MSIKAVKACTFTTSKEILRAIVSAGKVMAIAFWDKPGIIHVDFLHDHASISRE